MKLSFEQALIEVWRQALVEGKVTFYGGRAGKKPLM
jgi:hypothetical protein